jgi:hypothetical protein
MNQLPTCCPSCGGRLAVKRLHCDECQTEVEGVYQLPILASLPQADQEFILEFVQVGGSLKDMASHLNVSYPTVRNRLDDVIEKLKPTKTKEKK